MIDRSNPMRILFASLLAVFYFFFLPLGLGAAEEPAPQNSVTPPAVKVRPEIINTQKQIDEILHANERMKNISRTNAAEMQRIIDQANIHKKILQNMQAVTEQKRYASKDAEEILRQEKIRLIQEQTMQDRNWIERQAPQPIKLKQQPAASTEEKAAEQTAEGTE